MTDLSGSGGTGGVEGLPPGGTAIGVISVDDLTGLVADLESATTVDEAVSMIDRLGPSYAANQPGEGKAVVAGLLLALTYAYHSGSVVPKDTARAMQWVLQHLGLKAFDAHAIHSGAVARAFTAYGVAHRAEPKHVTPSPPPSTSPALGVGGQSEGTRTVGGRMVGEAQRGIKRATITAPGLDRTEAQAISLAIGRSYGDVMYTLINLVNALSGQIGAVADKVGQLTGAHTSPTAHTPAIPADVATELRLTTERITNLEHAVEVALEHADAAERLAKHVKVQPETQAVKSLGFEVTGIAAAVAAIRHIQETKATKVAVENLARDLKAFEESPPVHLLETQTSFLRSLPNTIKTLEDCCAENRAVTKPLSSIAKDASLLAKLKQMAVYAYAAFIVGGIVEVITMLFDAPAVIAGTIRGAAWVMPYAEQAALATLDDVRWADTVATGS